MGDGNQPVHHHDILRTNGAGREISSLPLAEGRVPHTFFRAVGLRLLTVDEADSI
jgi:hypothetical protein